MKSKAFLAGMMIPARLRTIYSVLAVPLIFGSAEFSFELEAFSASFSSSESIDFRV
jgi:hypothetical protein